MTLEKIVWRRIYEISSFGLHDLRRCSGATHLDLLDQHLGRVETNSQLATRSRILLVTKKSGPFTRNLLVVFGVKILRQSRDVSRIQANEEIVAGV